MDRLLIALTIPVFFALIALEWAIARRMGRQVYRWQDSIASLSTGILQQTSDLWLAAWALASYAFVLEHGRLLPELSMDSPLHWLLVGLGVDFLYYWFHRASHRINLLWAAHVVHHQSEEYNLTTALRQSTLQPLFNAPFFWPLAVLGVPTEAVVLAFTFNVLYQFWIHTRLVPALGPLERILCTPSNHRVHHGIDPAYIDKNYGGVLILWDRLFGTYQPELAEPNFGTVKPLRSWNPLWANMVYFKTLGERARAARGPAEWLYAWVAPPEWRPASQGGPVSIPEVDRHARPRYAAPAARATNSYVAAQYLWVVVVLVSVLLGGDGLAEPQRLSIAAWLTAAIAGWAGLFEGRAWARAVEWVRLGSAPLLAFWLLPDLTGGLTGVSELAIAFAHAAIALAMLLWLRAALKAATPPEPAPGPTRDFL